MRLIGQNDFERNYNEWIVRQELHRRNAKNASRWAAMAWFICGTGLEFGLGLNGWAFGIGLFAAVICIIAGVFDANMPHHYEHDQNH